jgi:hypothetical protein
MSITAASQQHGGAAPPSGRRARSASRAHRANCSLAAIVAVAACLAIASPASAAELVTNGGFETGTFSGWTTTEPTFPLAPWKVATAADPDVSGFGVFVAPSPPEGTYDALNGFDGSPGHFTLSQTISIPAATTASLTWQDRLQYEHSGQARLLEVKILNPATDAVLTTPYTYTTQPNDTRVDTGWQSRTADLSAFSGQTVKLVFDETIPENFTGPAQAELDAISVQTTPIPFAFTGFFAPIDNGNVLNKMNAGRAVPVKFSLDGDQGLDILADGSPSSQQIDCGTGDPDDVEETSTAGSSSLTYDAASDQYKYVWKTDSAWAGTCRQLTVTLSDGTSHTAKFKFT